MSKPNPALWTYHHEVELTGGAWWWTIPTPNIEIPDDAKYRIVARILSTTIDDILVDGDTFDFEGIVRSRIGVGSIAYGTHHPPLQFYATEGRASLLPEPAEDGRPHTGPFSAPPLSRHVHVYPVPTTDAQMTVEGSLLAGASGQGEASVSFRGLSGRVMIDAALLPAEGGVE